MEDYDFGITQKNINNLENSYTMLKEIYDEKLLNEFTKEYNLNLIKKYFNNIKNIINNK